MKIFIIQITIQALVIWGIQWYTAGKFYEKGAIDGYDLGIRAYERTCKKLIKTECK